MLKYEWLRDVLAVHRLTQLVVEDEISRPLREGISRRWPDSKVAYLVTCPACVSVWAGLAVSSGLVPRRVSWALALSAATLLVTTQDDRVGALVSGLRR